MGIISDGKLTISDGKLTIQHDPIKKTARVVVVCKVQFAEWEHYFLMWHPNAKLFRLYCQIWGKNRSLKKGGDIHLYTYPERYFFPKRKPNSSERRSFSRLYLNNLNIGDSFFRKDDRFDGIYGKLYLDNLVTMFLDVKKTNVISNIIQPTFYLDPN